MTTVVEPIIEEVATNLDEVAAITRTLNAAAISAFTFGIGTGAVIGFFWGYRYNKKKLRAEAFEYADKEIQEVTSELSEHYRQKVLALNDQKEKEPVEQIVRERGYLDDSRTDIVRPGPTDQDKLRAPVPIIGDPTETHKWDYSKENASRNPRLPYVIHKEEFDAFDAYTDVSYAWYPLDEVLVDDGGEKIENIADVVGAESLERFGHGSEDSNVVFVRNNELRLQIEIVRVPNESYEEHVQGLEISLENPVIMDDEDDDESN